MAGTAFPRFLLWMPLDVAEAATVAATQTPPDSSDADSADSAGVSQPVVPGVSQPVAPGDSTAARADSTKAPQGFESEAPETLRYIPPSDLPAGPPPSVAGTNPPPAPPIAEPNRPYGPMPKGGAGSGDAPKERIGFLGLAPAAIILGLVVIHVLVVRTVTR